ncbi:hypothetical protein GCM10007916_34260 [Psychromonas marina]|uniref:Asp/Glu/hydantoin racemase n=1 Tax=Psychromonas marina TaxID=88364 RepID=A0ABQ6E5G3_9GAMM|nr:hypothetical protein [Psychromonas marina]GLS92355.1 hypothetical protein GCM10007916_34260 [Psychromonas marina]
MQVKQVDITFLHTDQVHVNTFTELLNKYDESVTVAHIVKPQLLDDAIQNGITTRVTEHVVDILQQADKHSKLVVCSCSTLGSIAESTLLESGQYALRIDRAMANIAVNEGPRILVLAALKSTLPATTRLMNKSQLIQKSKNRIDYFVIENSWQYFLNSQYSLYYQAIAEVIKRKQIDYDCVVLAQASMAGVCELMIQKRPLIISSPEIGVKDLLQRLIQ